MGLQVWLPLNGTLENKGLSNITVTNNGTTFDTGGKIGSCYYNTNEYNCVALTGYMDELETYTTYSMCAWIYMTARPSGHSSTILSSGNWNTSNGNLCFALYNYSSGYTKLLIPNTGGWSTGINLSTKLQLETWYHIAITYDGTKTVGYVNGNYIGEYAGGGICANSNSDNLNIGKATYTNGFTLMGKINDVRIYDNCLSQKEISEISKALIVHYGLSSMENQVEYPSSVGENLLLGTRMAESDVAGFVSNSSTDWTKYIRYYNGDTTNYVFGGEGNRECTVLLNKAQNLGICFVRKATDINLDSTSNYTISCEAKCTSKATNLCIGLSYYTTGNAWTWRGGTNGKTITAANKWQKFTHTFKPDADTQYICYCFTIKGAANSTNTFTIRNCKLEKGSTATAYSPAPQEMTSLQTPYNTTSVADLSGYDYEGTPTAALTFNTDTPRYIDSTEFNGSKYIQVTSPSTEVRTISLWAKWNSIPSGQSVIFVDQKSKMGLGLMSTGILCSSNSVSTYTFSKSGIVANTWYHFVIVNTGTSPTATTRDLYINGVKQTPTSSTSNWTFANTLDYLQLGKRSTTSDGFSGKISDFRMYTTALSEADILDLYNAPAWIDNSGTMGGYEFAEGTDNGQSIEKTGMVSVKNFIESSDNLKLMADGSVFMRLLRHNNPTSKLFTANNCWLNTTDPDLYSSLILLKTVDWMRNLDTYEFLACEKLTSDGTEAQYRWKQANNPATTPTASGYQSVSGSATHLTAGLANAGTHGCFDINGSNWWCCCGCYTHYTYEGATGIPGFNNLVTTGYIELYIRIPDEMIKGSIDGGTKFFNQSIVSGKFKEI